MDEQDCEQRLLLRAERDEATVAFDFERSEDSNGHEPVSGCNPSESAKQPPCPILAAVDRMGRSETRR